MERVLKSDKTMYDLMWKQIGQIGFISDVSNEHANWLEDFLRYFELLEIIWKVN